MTQKPCFVKWCVALREPGSKIDGCKIHELMPKYVAPSYPLPEEEDEEEDWLDE